MGLSKNKGEWSEVLVLANVLATGELKPVGADLSPIDHPPLKTVEAALRLSNGSEWSNETVYGPNSPIDPILARRLIRLGTELRHELKQTQESSFESIPGNQILSELNLGSNTVSGKVDIWLRVASPLNPSGELLGFSIKSNIGSPSTLFNASKRTNFKFKLTNFTGESLQELQSERPIQQRIKKFVNDGGDLELDSVSSNEFSHNLELTDSRLEADLGRIVKAYYSTGQSSVTKLIEDISLDAADPYFESKLEYRVRKFLLNVALGMTPGTRWDTRTLAYGGYLIVTDEGEIVCLPAQNSDALADFLAERSYLDTPSTSRHAFGFPFEENGHWFINLNLQIRFRN